MSKRPRKPLSELIDVKHGFAFSGEHIRDERSRDILLTPGNFAIGGGFKGGKFKYYDGEVPEGFVLSEGDLIVTMTDLSKQADSLGYPAIVPSSLGARFLHNQRIGKVVIKPGVELDKGYLYYLLRTDEYRHEVVASASGTTVKHTSPSRILAYKAPIPSLAEQKAIAAILGSLDQKIELNQQMSMTLEEMARALFQSWFVDFDPVRAKVDDHTPFMLDAETSNLFPARFQESQLGHIPSGWTAGTFGSVISSKRERVVNEDVVVLSAVARSQLIRSEDHFRKQVYSKSVRNYLKVRRWDFAYNPSRINIGSVGMLKKNIIGAVSPIYEVFRPISGYHWFVERAISEPDTRVQIQTLCSGSVRQSLKLQDLLSIPLVIPPPLVVNAFNVAWERWSELIHAYQVESSALAALRDTLLPELLGDKASTSTPGLNRCPTEARAISAELAG